MWQKDSQLVTTCHWIGAKAGPGDRLAICPVRQDDTWCWLSESGRDKGNLTTEDFCRLRSPPTRRLPDGSRRPRPVCTLVYRLFPEANVVLLCNRQRHRAVAHRKKSDTLALQGYEMQKTLGAA